MLSKNELIHATNCDGNCYLCDMGIRDFSGKDFGCTKELAKTAIELQKALKVKMFAEIQVADLIQENRKLRILCRNLECCSCCKNKKNKKICKDCNDSGVNLKSWEFDEEILDKIV